MKKLKLSGALVVIGLAGCGGGEPTRADRESAVRTVDEYFSALSIRQWDQACERLAADERGAQCATRLNTGFADAPDELLADLAEVEVAQAGVEGSEVRVRVRTSGAFSVEPRTVVVPVKQEEGKWRIARLGDELARPDDVQSCFVQSLEFYEAGDTAAFWRKEGREDFAEYSRRLCKAIVRAGADPSSREEVTPVAARVIRDMVRQGRIEEP